jgi:hypothetical protein
MNIVKRNPEQMTLALDKPENLPKVSLFVGGVSGAALIAVPFLTTNGPAIFIPYAALVIGFYMLVRNTEVGRLQRFAAGLGSFMLASLILYLYIALIANPRFALNAPLWEHIWRLAFLLAIGVVINGVMTFLQTRSVKKLQ